MALYWLLKVNNMNRLIESPALREQEAKSEEIQIVCSNCGEVFRTTYGETKRFNYCPVCGAKMEKNNEI